MQDTEIILLTEITLLTYLFSMRPWCFQSVEKGCIGNKWVNSAVVRSAQIQFKFQKEYCQMGLGVFNIASV